MGKVLVSKEANSPSILTSGQITKVHLLSELKTHILFGAPLLALTLTAWGTANNILTNILMFYGLILVIFIVLDILLPFILLSNAAKIRKKIVDQESVNNAEVEELISNFLNYPLKVSIIIFTLQTIGFIEAMYIISSVIHLDLQNINGVLILLSFLLCLLITGTAGLLNYVSLERTMRQAIETIVSIYPQILNQAIEIKRIRLYSKVFISVVLTSATIALSLLIPFVGKMLLTSSQTSTTGYAHTIGILVIDTIYFYLIAPAFINNIVTPLKKLVEWNQDVMRGNLERKMPVVTNDEIFDVISYSNKMVSQLNNITYQLQESMDAMSKERDLFSLETYKMHAVLGGILDGVIAMDPNFKIILMNQAAEQMTGWTQREALGQFIGNILRMVDEENNQMMVINKLHANTNKPESDSVSKNSVKLLTKDNQEVFINFTSHPISEGISSNIGYIITFHNTSQEMELEKLKLDFVAMAAHELRTPLTAILGYMSVFLDDNQSKLDEEQLLCLNRVNTASHQLNGLIENLLSIAKIERGQFTLSFEQISWPSIIKEIIDQLKFNAQEKNIEVLFYEPAPDFPSIIEADKIRVGEVISNLIANAINYTPGPGKVSVWMESNGREITTYVQDTGIGIPTAAIPHLFSKFYRVSGHLKPGSKGTGLGLYMSKSIIDLHKGKIWVSSEEGKGSTFCFTLPIKQTKETTPSQTVISDVNVNLQPARLIRAAA